jgi:hypothetical protein
VGITQNRMAVRSFIMWMQMHVSSALQHAVQRAEYSSVLNTGLQNAAQSLSLGLRRNGLQ